MLGTYFNNRQPGVGKEVFGKEHICFANVRSYLVIRQFRVRSSRFLSNQGTYIHILPICSLGFRQNWLRPRPKELAMLRRIKKGLTNRDSRIYCKYGRGIR